MPTMGDFTESSRSARIPNRDPSVPLSSNKHLLKWIQKMFTLTQPDTIHWVDGSEEEYDALCKRMVEGGTLIMLNEELWPGCYYAKSDPHGDVAVWKAAHSSARSPGRVPARRTTGQTPLKCAAS